MIDAGFLREGIAHSPHQPATCLFRAVELGHLLAEDFLPRTGRMLDLGCGDGWINSMLRRRFDADWATSGIDPDQREVELAGHAGVYRELKVAFGDNLPFANGTFDVVFSNSVLEHIPQVEPVLSEAARVLKPGGAMIFTVPSSHFEDMLSFPTALGKFVSGARVRPDYIDYMNRRLAHRYYWSLDHWTAELSKVSLKVERHFFYLAAPELKRWETLSHLTAGLVGKLTSSKKHPIELQHQLGIRRGKASPLINWTGRLLGSIGRRNLPRNIPPHSTQGACLAVLARKTHLAAS